MVWPSEHGRILMYAMPLLNLKMSQVCRMQLRHILLRLVGTSYILKGGDPTETTFLEEEAGVEAGLATNPMEEGDAMEAGVLAELMVKIIPIMSTDHQEEMVSIGTFIVKTEHFLAMDRALIKPK
nr:hypothetical protein Iba_chr12dCG3100 [Ipomoea batatas]